jgi:hypothetical protein
MSGVPLRFGLLIDGEVGEASPLEELVLSKLVRVLGKDKAAGVLDDALQSAQLRGIESVQELLAFANELVKTPGFPAVVGRSLKVYAILRGAIE